MERWYHSGIEGYCKSAAQAMGLPNDQSGWGNFGRDLFGDGRFDDPVKASKTWTLSRFRTRGRSNRPLLFESSWLGSGGAELEFPAIETCMRSIVDERRESTLRMFYLTDYLEFANGFRRLVLPSIYDGFRTERYHSADIVRFGQGMDEALGNLRPSDSQSFGLLVRMLVAALIYGPDHRAARTPSQEATIVVDQTAPAWADDDFEIDETVIRVSQLYSATGSLVGYTELFGENKAVLFGRSGEIDNYRSKIGPEFFREIADRELVCFPIAGSHKRTSNEHGAIARIGDNWYYYDFSTNGTYVENGGTGSTVHNGITAIRPGDRLCLGVGSDIPEGSFAKLPDALRYRQSATVLLSFNIDDSV